MSKQNTTSPLVSADWLEENLDNPNIKIIEVDENPQLYIEQHIPGAIGLDWQKDLQDPNKRSFLNAKDFAELLSSLGVRNDDQIILYGDRNNWFAAYTYWYLKYYQHDNVKLLDGPREKWIADGRTTSNEIPDYPRSQYLISQEDETIRARRFDVHKFVEENPRQAVEEQGLLIDVRSPQEYSGELLAMPGYEQEGAQRAGHIPGAKSIPWATAVNDDGTFKSQEELHEIYSSQYAGQPENQEVITYCRIGERSAHTWFVLSELLGYKNVRNYDGSWTEWGNLIDAPIELGSN